MSVWMRRFRRKSSILILSLARFRVWNGVGGLSALSKDRVLAQDIPLDPVRFGAKTATWSRL